MKKGHELAKTKGELKDWASLGLAAGLVLDQEHRDVTTLVADLARTVRWTTAERGLIAKVLHCSLRTKLTC